MPTVEKKSPKLIDERLVTALSHETRVHALAVFHDRPASTKEVAEELGQSVSAVWYHVDKLLQLDCIELVSSKRRRGATERFYRATVSEYLDEEAWSGIPKSKRLAITMGLLRLVSSDLDEAIKAETIGAPDNHISRSLFNLDRQGWDDSKEILERTLEELFRVREESTMRLAEDEGADLVKTSISILQYELPKGPAATGTQRATD